MFRKSLSFILIISLSSFSILALAQDNNEDWIRYEEKDDTTAESKKDPGKNAVKSKDKKARRASSDSRRQKSLISRLRSTNQVPINLNRVSLAGSYSRNDAKSGRGESTSGGGVGLTHAFGAGQNWIVGFAGATARVKGGREDNVDARLLGIGYASYFEKSAVTFSLLGGRAGRGVGGIGLDFIQRISPTVEVTASLMGVRLLDEDYSDDGATVSSGLGANFFVTRDLGLSIDVGRDSNRISTVSIGFVYRL